MRFPLFVFGLTLSLLLAGCSTPPEERLEAPSTKVTALSLTSGTGSLTLRFTNPNAVPLVISSSTHALSLGEKSIGTIDNDEPVGLPPLGTVEHSIKLTPKLAQAAQTYLQSQKGDIRATVKNSLTIAISGDDTITLKCIGSGLVKAP